MSGDNTANTAKVQGYALCLPTKRMGLPRTSPIMLLPCHEIARSKALATAPHLTPTHVAHLSHSSTPNRTKKPPCAQQESQCARRLNDGLPERVGFNINKGNAMIITTFPVIFFIVQTSRPADVGTFSTAKLQISLFLCKFIRKNLCFHL